MSEVKIEEHLGVEALQAMIMNFASDGIEEYRSLVATLERNEYWSKIKKFELEYKAS